MNHTHLLAMQAVVEFARMRRYCLSRTYCKGCPYHATMGCASPTTEGLLFMVAKVFEEYLFLQEIEKGMAVLDDHPLIRMGP